MSPRYDLPRTRAALSTLAVAFALAATAAQAGSGGSCPHASPTVACAAAPAPAATLSRLATPVWTPEWLSPAFPSDVADYTALYGTPVAPIAPGMLIAIDPETGMPTRPTAEQIRVLTAGMENANALIEPLAPMLMERLPGGGVAMHLNGHFQMYSIARIGPDGRPVADCSVDAATARRLLVTPAIAPVARVKE